jgi:hypothetical protein
MTNKFLIPANCITQGTELGANTKMLKTYAFLTSAGGGGEFSLSHSFVLLTEGKSH